jgi:hypothetical protein
MKAQRNPARVTPAKSAAATPASNTGAAMTSQRVDPRSVGQ